MPATITPEEQRLAEANERRQPWRKWGPYVSERQWGTVREDYSSDGNAWNYFNHDQSRSRSDSSPSTAKAIALHALTSTKRLLRNAFCRHESHHVIPPQRLEGTQGDAKEWKTGPRVPFGVAAAARVGARRRSLRHGNTRPQWSGVHETGQLQWVCKPTGRNTCEAPSRTSKRCRERRPA